MKYLVIGGVIATIALTGCGGKTTTEKTALVKATPTATATVDSKDKQRDLKREAATLVIQIGALAGKYSDTDQACAHMDEISEKYDRLTPIVDQLVELDPNFDTKESEDLGDNIKDAEANCDVLNSANAADTAEPTLTTAQENAIESAQSYLDSGDFSKKGLISQLKYEDFSKSDAKFAVNHVDADWKQEAVEAANSYLDSGSFSKQGLYEQLIYEKFTPTQAAYAIGEVY
jgi:hypothetical protein